MQKKVNTWEELGWREVSKSIAQYPISMKCLISVSYLKKKNHLFCILLHKWSVAPYLKYKEFLLPNLVKLAFQAHEPCVPHGLHRPHTTSAGFISAEVSGSKSGFLCNQDWPSLAYTWLHRGRQLREPAGRCHSGKPHWRHSTHLFQQPLTVWPCPSSPICWIILSKPTLYALQHINQKALWF